MVRLLTHGDTVFSRIEGHLRRFFLNPLWGARVFEGVLVKFSKTYPEERMASYGPVVTQGAREIESAHLFKSARLFSDPRAECPNDRERVPF